MRTQSRDEKEDYEWYKLKTTILGVREKKSGGFSIKISQTEDIKSFVLLLTKILQFLLFLFIILYTLIPLGI